MMGIDEQGKAKRRCLDSVRVDCRKKRLSGGGGGGGRVHGDECHHTSTPHKS